MVTIRMAFTDKDGTCNCLPFVISIEWSVKQSIMNHHSYMATIISDNIIVIEQNFSTLSLLMGITSMQVHTKVHIHLHCPVPAVHSYL